MQFTVREAKTHLSKLINLVLAGEEVIITRNGVPVVRLTPLVEEQPAHRLSATEETAASGAGKLDAPSVET